MILSHAQVRLLRKGTVSHLDFPFDLAHPDRGRPAECCVILEWEPERRLWDQAAGQIVTVPRQPLLWAEVTGVNRHRKGHWRVQLSVTDHRHQPRYLAAGGSYTTSRFRAIDELEVIPRKDLDRMAKVAYERDQTRRLEKVAAARTSKNRFRKERLRAVERLRSAA